MAAIVVAHCLVVSLTSLARVAGILGGLCWIARAILDDGDGPTAVIDALHYGGLALLVIALLGIGAGLVSGTDGAPRGRRDLPRGPGLRRSCPSCTSSTPTGRSTGSSAG